MNAPVQNSMTPVRRWLGLAGWLLLCFAAASFGGLFLPGEWYAGLKKPSWNPPGWIFGPVWTGLYALMAIAAWLVWKRGGAKAMRLPLGLFLLQLLFNALWSWLFFGRHQPALALVDLMLLWLSLLATLVAFRKVNVIAGRLLVPYLLWVSFAAALNFALWRLNG
jgi:translocator protein